MPDHGPQVGPFGFAISPDGRTVAAGWVGGPVEVIGPKPATLRDIGAPLVVADDGRIVAVTGRVGDAYLLEGDKLVELAAPESDPVAVPGSGLVAWASIGDDGALDAVEVRDLLAGTSETYPAGGTATNVRGAHRGPRHPRGHGVRSGDADDRRRRPAHRAFRDLRGSGPGGRLAAVSAGRARERRPAVPAESTNDAVTALLP